MSESDQVRALRARYRESLSEKAEIVRQWHARSLENGWDKVDEAELGAWLHKLAGSAGMYEYDEIAEMARSLLPDLSESKIPLAKLQQKLNELLETLEKFSLG